MKYYHNITKRKYNQTCVLDIIEGMDAGDLILFSESGCAILEELPELGLQELQQEVDEYYLNENE